MHLATDRTCAEEHRGLVARFTPVRPGRGAYGTGRPDRLRSAGRASGSATRHPNPGGGDLHVRLIFFWRVKPDKLAEHEVLKEVLRIERGRCPRCS